MKNTHIVVGYKNIAYICSEIFKISKKLGSNIMANSD